MRNLWKTVLGTMAGGLAALGVASADVAPSSPDALDGVFNTGDNLAYFGQVPDSQSFTIGVEAGVVNVSADASAADTGDIRDLVVNLFNADTGELLFTFDLRDSDGVANVIPTQQLDFTGVANLTIEILTGSQTGFNTMQIVLNDVTPADVVPLPGAAAFLVTGLVGAFAARRRRKNV